MNKDLFIQIYHNFYETGNGNKFAENVSRIFGISHDGKIGTSISAATKVTLQTGIWNQNLDYWPQCLEHSTCSNFRNYFELN